MRYIVIHEPDENPEFQWQIEDVQDPVHPELMGRCWDEPQARIVAAALNLIEVYGEIGAINLLGLAMERNG